MNSASKLIVITIIIAICRFLIAIYTRFVNIDTVIRQRNKTFHPSSVVLYDMLQQFTYGSTGGNFIILDNKLRLYSSCIPPVVIRINIAKDGRKVFISDTTGKHFLLGNIGSVQSKENMEYYTVALESKDKISLRTSFSLFPYYHGFSLFLSGPLFRYYHYYSFRVEKESGAFLLLEWKFSTYKGPDGNLVPDLFGDNKEGLVKVLIGDGK